MHRRFFSPRAAGAALALIAVPAVAEPDPFSALVGKRAARPERMADAVDRYVVSADGRVFLFQSRDLNGRIKFLCYKDDPRLDCEIDPDGPAEEIVALTGTRGSRGDLIYKNAEGAPLLRIGAYGGATVFWPGDPFGQAASKSYGEGDSLSLTAAGRGAAHRRAQSAAAHLSALTGEPMQFDIGPRRPPALLAKAAEARAAPAALRADAAPLADEEEAADAPGPGRGDATVLADAVARVAAGMMAVADDPTGARILGVRVRSVKFERGAAAGLALDGATLVVTYDPTGDIDGRPSSAAVAQFLEESL
ncbi:MAG: DUF4908 domain-containing protein [Amphiplicatus sp.]